jgi:hypothetical protein
VLIWVTIPELDRMMGMMLPLVGTQLPTGLACEALRVRAKQPARLRQLLVAGSPEGRNGASSRKGAGLPMPSLVLFDDDSLGGGMDGVRSMPDVLTPGLTSTAVELIR